MNEKHRLFIVLGVVAAIILFVVGIIVVDNKKQMKVFNEFKEVFEGNENTLVYIGSSNCNYCKLLNPSLADMKERYDFDYFYVDVNEVSSSVVNKIVDVLGLSSYGTPYLAVVSNGKVVDSQVQYADYDVIFEFLQKNGIIKEDEQLLLNYIGLDEYKNQLAEDELNVIVIGQSTCTYCVQAKVVLNELVEQKGMEINYLNISYLDSDEKTEVTNSLDYLKEGFGTPVMLITKNGKLVDTYEGYAPLESYIKFLEENEVL